MQLSDNTNFNLNQNNEKSDGKEHEESKDYDLIFSPEFQNQTALTNQNTTFDEKSRSTQSETSRGKLVQMLCGVLFQLSQS